MPKAPLPLLKILGAAGVTTVGGLLEFLAVADDYEELLIQYLARVGKKDARSKLSEASALVSGAQADGWRELADEIDNGDDAIDDPDRH